MTTTERTLAPEDWERVHQSADFARLRRKLRSFVFPMTGLFLAWYLLYVLLADYAPEFMSTEVLGHVNVGLLFGLGQFVSTFVITGLYVRHANKHLDPVADKLRDELEEVAAK
ncbi:MULTISPECIES: DUF485 domain-containing protein [Thermocrispum]|jgi:uncharacterized membrane protein (DUF485 family)|uniref:DUF485 domain-containing protein n=1 Tax=Thermocrispum agreste TaxID=37925 RepID=A0A2W4J6N3_9PSEU|nr:MULTISPECIES: DUF485 domain-containing protein [Thermocrispum]PZM94812.1 MAG: DUF485 domain-containing protein [Thermocrispum agreste]